jgi:hypothetical protein
MASWSRPPLNSSTSPAPSPRCAHACARSPRDGRCVFVHGGFDGERLLADLSVLHVTSMTWTKPVCMSKQQSQSQAQAKRSSVSLSPDVADTPLSALNPSEPKGGGRRDSEDDSGSDQNQVFSAQKHPGGPAGRRPGRSAAAAERRVGARLRVPGVSAGPVFFSAGGRSRAPSPSAQPERKCREQWGPCSSGAARGTHGDLRRQPAGHFWWGQREELRVRNSRPRHGDLHLGSCRSRPGTGRRRF